MIVESPAKAKTIAGYLGRGYIVESSIGHIRDLPEKADDIPEKYKGEPWARLGVNVEHDFEPLYVVNPDKKPQVTKLKQLLQGRRRALPRHGRGPRGRGDRLAPARGAQAQGARCTAWSSTRSPRTPSGEAVANPRDLNLRLVDAQETRRILDRLYGYEVSPVLWKKVKPRLSAGRVQSVATRLVVERERERMAFTPADYWDLAGAVRHRRADEEPPHVHAPTLTARRRQARRPGPRLHLRPAR